MTQVQEKNDPVSDGAASRRIFELFLIKPSHYDDDGYVIQWAWSSIPSNTLAVMYGLALDCANRFVLGPDVDIRITAWDETNTRIVPARIVDSIRAAGGRGLVALVGVQTNQFPRAMDIARILRAAEIPVCIGGFHVSGSISMLPEIPSELHEATGLGVSLFAGDAEGRFDDVLKAAAGLELLPLYNFVKDLPGLQGAPVPYLPASVISRTQGRGASFDAGRGCPFHCSFCTIINVQGRESRFRSADDVELIVRKNLAQGVDRFFITDDNLARNQNWEAIFDRLILMREQENLRVHIVAQVDTACHKVRFFIEKAARAGVHRVFIGLENINPDSLKGAHKGQNQIVDYRTMLQEWHSVGVLTCAGYILGFPGDTPASIERDIGIIQRELPIDILTFFILTPLPGSADHRDLYVKGVEMDRDLNKYDTVHVTTPHARMSHGELAGIYLRAWDLYYSAEHVETVLRRAKTWGADLHGVMWRLLTYHAPPRLMKIHPMEGGLFRRKRRRDRRVGLPRESSLIYYPRETWNMVVSHLRFFRMLRSYRRILNRVIADDSPYSDAAITPVHQEELDTLKLYSETRGSAGVVDKRRRRTKRVDTLPATFPRSNSTL